MRKQSGFSLIELMTAMAILTVLVLISAPSAIEWMDNAKLGSATRDVLSILQEGRMHAIKENSMTEIKFNNGTNKFLVRKMDRSKETVEWGEVVHQLPAGMKLDATFGSGSTIKFNSRGLPNLMGRVEITNLRGTTFKVVVNFTGGTRIERVTN